MAADMTEVTGNGNNGSGDNGSGDRMPAEKAFDTVSPQSFRDGMSRIASPVHIVTTGGDAGIAGITATSVCAVTDTPPTLLVCVNRDSRSNPLFKANRVFCVNTLPATARELADIFAGKRALSPADRFADTAWSPLSTSAPTLEDAIAVFDCRIVTMQEFGTHTMFLGKVLAMRHRASGRDSLLYADRSYHALA